ncbi:SRPBCC domain-containing protein [Hyphobacterium sp. HN65]|uniref:SRPBCC domain-containing protein n=1 Tax=Hyphobacterium lacteum TaxID=3116575 RepID=A0ABU7LP04_9PROT|nr:SRPBCC domain-containing protein [Hyphobacterium sp. HN65]MEE2525650.1 SRPBCC domain-containing protein [Hyphobacterium sp. HN65]
MFRVLVAALAAFASLPFAAAATDRIIVASVEVEASPGTIWDMWTTEDGLSFFAPASNIDLRPGGAYEVYFLPDAPEGQRGSEGTTILGFQENRMLTITWALPPYMPDVRPYLTPLTIEIIPVSDTTTSVTITHTGWGEGGEWDDAYAYFQRNWPLVLSAMSDALTPAAE